MTVFTSNMSQIKKWSIVIIKYSCGRTVQLDANVTRLMAQEDCTKCTVYVANLLKVYTV